MPMDSQLTTMIKRMTGVSPSTCAPISDSANKMSKTNLNPCPVDYKFNIGIVGDRGVGKSSLLSCFGSDVNFLTDPISESRQTSNIIKFGDDKTVKLWVWELASDPSSPERVIPAYNKYDGIIIVYDCEKLASFDNVDSWIDMLDSQAPRVSKLLVGNKCDSDFRKVCKESAKNFARNARIEFLETSAKNSMNVKQAFMVIAAEVRTKLRDRAEEANLQRDGHLNFGYSNDLANLSDLWVKIEESQAEATSQILHQITMEVEDHEEKMARRMEAIEDKLKKLVNNDTTN